MTEKLGDSLPALDESHTAETQRVLALSDFVSQSLQRDTKLLADLVESNDLFSSYDPLQYAASLKAYLSDCADDKQLGELLRKYRRREMVRIAWRDLAGRADLVETTADLSHLADACIDAALEHLYAWHCAQWGTPMSEEG